MSIINKYLTKEIIKLFGFILIMVVGIYIIVDFLEKIDDFLEAGLSFSKAFAFFVYKTPFITAQIAPVGILLSVLIVFGLMNRNNEIIALTSSGVSTFYLLRPVIIIGLYGSKGTGSYRISAFLIPWKKRFLALQYTNLIKNSG